MRVKPILLISIILGLSIFLRAYNIEKVPPSLNWDEAAIGWNAKAIWLAKVDEYGTRWPLSFRSFGDWKAPFLIYFTAPFVGILGLDVWVVRLPSILFGIGGVLLMYLLASEFAERLGLKDKHKQVFSFIAMGLLAISPWHLQYSRGAYEANVGLTFIIAGIWLLLLGLRYWWAALLGGLSLVLSIYTYHSPKVFIPVFTLAFVIIYWNEIKKIVSSKLPFIIISIITVSLAAYPVVKDNLIGKGAERAGTSVFFDSTGKIRNLNTGLVFDIGSNIVKHLNPLFYVYGSNANYRNQLQYFGLMSVIAFVFLLIGLMGIVKQPNKHSLLLPLWYFCGLLPGIISKTNETPHHLRSILALPAIILITAFGFIIFLNWLQKNKYEYKRTLLVFVLILSIADFGRYLYEYYVLFPVYGAKDWQYGYQQVTQIVQQYDNSVEKIIITNAYGQPHIFTQFFQGRNPLYVMWGEMVKYQYRPVDWESEQNDKKTLLIGTGKELPSNIPADKGKILGTVNFPDGSVAFRIVKTN